MMDSKTLSPIIPNSTSLQPSAYGLSNLASKSFASSEVSTNHNVEPGTSPRPAQSSERRRPSLPSSASSSDFLRGMSSIQSTSPVKGSSSPGVGKRAYRQRRKDPSCDACRERKVKCDATDAASCTECSTRGVQCLLTRDPNRRLSSIRHLQDLERQLDQANNKIAELRRLLDQSNSTTIDTASSRTESKWTHINANTSSQATESTVQDVATSNNVTYLDRGTAIRLLVIYHESIDWRTLAFNIDIKDSDLDHALSYFSRNENESVRFGTVFAALAYASIYDNDLQNVRPLLSRAIKAFDICGTERGLDHANMALLISITLQELNDIASSRVWIVLASQILHDMQKTDCYQNTQDVKCSWHAISIWSSLLELQTGPLLGRLQSPKSLNDSTVFDFRQKWSSPCDKTLTAQQDASRLLHAAHQTISEAGTSTNSQELPRPGDTDRKLSMLENDCRRLFTDAGCHTALLAPLCELMGLRFLFARNVILLLSDPAARYLAIQRCVELATATSNYFEQALNALGLPKHPDEARVLPASQAFRAYTTTSSSLHLWRCILILLYHQEYVPVNALLETMILIGNHRQANMACGQHLKFFLQHLLGIGRGGSIPPEDHILELALGDLQRKWTTNWNEENGFTEEDTIERSSHMGVVLEEQSEDQLWSGLRRSLRHLQQLYESRTSESAVAMEVDQVAPTTIRPSTRISIKDLM